MKETSPIEKDKVEEVREVQQESKTEFIGRFKLEKGHTLWEINKKTLEINKAEFEQLPAAPFKKPVTGPNHKHPVIRMRQLQLNQTSTAKVIQKADCTYVGALNIKNAYKKIGIDIKKLKFRKIKKEKP